MSQPECRSPFRFSQASEGAMRDVSGIRLHLARPPSLWLHAVQCFLPVGIFPDMSNGLSTLDTRSEPGLGGVEGGWFCKMSLLRTQAWAGGSPHAGRPWSPGVCQAAEPSSQGGPWAEAVLPPMCAHGDVDTHSHTRAPLLTQ